MPDKGIEDLTVASAPSETQTDARNFGGYGIGLYIAQAIVTGHKGQIRAATEDGKSLTITASFPAE